MKKNAIQIALIGLLAFTISSCEKTYECHCVKKAGGETHEDVKAKKADADAECKKLAEGSTVYSECHLE
jgi:hypothetical protein